MPRRSPVELSKNNLFCFLADWCLIHLWLNRLDWIKQNLLNQKGLIHRQDCLIHKPWLNQTHWESGLIESKKLMIHELKKIEVNEHSSLSTNINTTAITWQQKEHNKYHTIPDILYILFFNWIKKESFKKKLAESNVNHSFYCFLILWIKRNLFTKFFEGIKRWLNQTKIKWINDWIDPKKVNQKPVCRGERA